MIEITKFSAEWCPPCQKMKPVMEELKKLHSEWKITEIDVDQQPELADKENIQSVPTLIFSDGKRTKRVSRYMSRIEIEVLVKKQFGGNKNDNHIRKIWA